MTILIYFLVLYAFVGNPFSKTYKHKCPDGSEKVVYKNVDDAFPLINKSWVANIKAIVNYLESVKTEVGVVLRKELAAYFYKIDEINSSMQLQFRGVYVVYKSDPCALGAWDYLRESVDKINSADEELRKIDLEIKAKVSGVERISRARTFRVPEKASPQKIKDFFTTKQTTEPTIKYLKIEHLPEIDDQALPDSNIRERVVKIRKIIDELTAETAIDQNSVSRGGTFATLDENKESK